MIYGFFFIVGGLGLLMGLEYKFPDRELVAVPNWWIRVLAINLAQLIIVIVGAYTWEQYFQSVPSILSLKDLKFMTPALGGFIAYVINSYIFYWFHRARHEIYLFWILFHQVHHSAARIEAITSFYKHPLEIFIDSILMTILLYPILGLSTASSIWLSIFSAYGEYFYHMNIKTPHFIGYFFQRPESHRVHHLRNKRAFCVNYSDFPLWDILGKTFHNPENDIVLTGYIPENEVRLGEMLCFKDVINRESKHERDLGLNLANFFSLMLLVVGLLQPIGYLFNQPDIQGLGVITVASPLPLVFSAYNGVETFRTSFDIDLVLTAPDFVQNNFAQDNFIDNFLNSKNTDSLSNNLESNKAKLVSVSLTKSIYSQIKGPYNRRNVFGVLFSHGPFFQHSNLIKLRDHLLRYAICENKLELLGLIDKNSILLGAHIKVTSRKTIGFWEMWVIC